MHCKTVDLRSGRSNTGWQIGCARTCLGMLAYHLEWHMRQRLAPMLFDDTDKNAAEALRTPWWHRRIAHPPLSPSRPPA